MAVKKNGKDPLDAAVRAAAGLGVPTLERIKTVNIETTLHRGVKVQIVGLPESFDEADFTQLVNILVQVHAQLQHQRRAAQGGAILGADGSLLA